jgi:trans-aconitate 2-methyltransferase
VNERADDVYTFGTTPDAAHRLALLADLFAPPTRDLLARCVPPDAARPVRHAVDLGCGPGHTTRLLHAATGAARTTGVERSADFLALAREDLSDGVPDGVTFVEADVTRAPLPVDPADVVHARFLLTHLAAPVEALRTWAGALADGGRLVLHEVAALDSADPVLHRYYGLVADLQRHHGQALDIGDRLSALGAAAGLEVAHAAVVAWQPDAARMAALHVINLRTWRHDPYIAGSTDPADLDALDAGLVEIARGRPCAPVEQSLGEAVLTL